VEFINVYWPSGLKSSLSNSDIVGSTLKITEPVPRFQIIVGSDNGTISGGGYYQLGATATLTATPNPGYIFIGWTGDASGTANPLSLTVDADKTVGATFEKDLTDADGDGISAYDELVLYGTDPNLVDTDNDGLEDGEEINGIQSNPLIVDTDGDGVPDGLEVKEKTSPVDAAKFNSFSQGIQAYYPFDGNAKDESGNGHDIIGEALVYSDDRRSQKNMSLALANSFTSSNPVYLNSNASRTLSQWVKVVEFPSTTDPAWVKPSAPYFAYPSSVIIGNGFAADGEWWMDTGSGVAFYDWGITTNWTHIVVVYDGDVTQAKVYRDGVRIPLKSFVFDRTEFVS
jgi:uncharacterized repeat protein (TIGR02543 family)